MEKQRKNRKNSQDSTHLSLLETQSDMRFIRFDALSKLHIWAYGVGHLVNDLAAACWFNYLFFFLKKIVETDAAAAAMLAGQICDGLATPIVGVLSDRV